jgi:4-hydroxybenzoate polyprenyltransferase
MIPIVQGMVAVPCLVALSLAIATQINKAFLVLLIAYLITSSLYSFWLKRLPIVDVYCLASLYTLRIIGGHLVTGIRFSSWLLAFSMFLFLSFALVKRFSEAKDKQGSVRQDMAGRGYRNDDLHFLMAIGVASGSMAVLVMALYINSPDVALLYKNPAWLWGLCLLFYAWISRVWLKAHRGEVHSDPIVFALRDRPTWLISLFCVLVMAAATLG